MLEKLIRKIKVAISKYINWKILLLCFILALFTIPFVFIFTSINKKWYDGLSVASIIYICLSLLSIIFKHAQFKTFSKIKNLFLIKKENSEPFTKFEKAQMDALNISFKKTKINEINFIGVSIIMLIYGIILLIISLCFIF